MVLTLYYREELNLKEIGAVLDVGNPASANCTVRRSNGCARGWRTIPDGGPPPLNSMTHATIGLPFMP